MNTQQPGGNNLALLDPDTAFAIVHQRVYSPVFFEKLAQDHGVRYTSEQEAMDMLTMAAQLRMAHDHTQKQAAVRQNPVSAAKAHLAQQLTKMGFDIKSNQAAPQRIKQAAVQASFDPELAHAILSMQAVANGVTQEQLTAA